MTRCTQALSDAHPVVAALKASADQLGGFYDREWLATHGVSFEDKGFLWIPEVGAPACQFNDLGIIPEVEETMRLMGAYDDPYGVACWFLLPHSWLEGHASPASLAQSAPATLLELAQHLANGD
jgi:hypothetical protein